MAATTAIAWTDHTFNPWMGCAKISAGCAHCYAEELTRNRMGLDLWGPRKARQPTKTPWRQVRAWEGAAARGEVGIRGPGHRHLVFVGSLMDWAEAREDLDPLRERLWGVIRESHHLEFQMLTKRADRIARCLPADWGQGYPNVWLGVSIEDQRVADRADHLREIPAAIRFVSYEPALGPLELDLAGLDWVIYGGESGPGYRPEDKDWARSMRAQCQAAGVAFFHKQSSARRTEQGIELDGQIIREFPAGARKWKKEGTGFGRSSSNGRGSSGSHRMGSPNGAEIS
jgi:protein gp37